MSRATRKSRPFVLLAPVVALLALAIAGVAAADHLDPERAIRPADQTRARAMLLRASDFAPGARREPAGADPHSTCRGLDESDLTLTGEADSPVFVSGAAFYGSTAVVYRSPADAKASWKRSSSRAGAKCIEDLYRRGYARQGLVLESFERRSFPRMADGSLAFRAVLSGQAQGMTVRLTLDLVGLRHSRAQVGFIVGSVVPPSKADEVRLARLTARRMAAAMRGS